MLKLKLERVGFLLKIAGNNHWAKLINNCIDELIIQPEITTRKILSFYGGLGSFNDVVLYKNGELLKSENVEFDNLRSEIYTLCVESLK